MRLKLQSFTTYFFASLFLITQPCCSDSRPRKDQVKDGLEDKPLKKTKPGSSYPDTIKINTPAAVFYSPDSLQLEKIKAVTDPMIFEGTMHDCFYQVRNSKTVLKKSYKYLRIVEVKDARYVVFEKVNGEKEYLDLDTKNDPCGLFLFDGSKSHQWVDMTNIETELGFYFGKSPGDR